MPSYTHWSDNEIELLSRLYQMDLGVEEISRVLDRSPRAVDHAIKNLLMQELAHATPSKVLRKYNLTPDNLYYDYVPEKYYQTDKRSALPIILAAMIVYIVMVGVGMLLTKE